MNLPEGSISIHNLYKSFGDKVVLNHVDLDIHAGEIFFVIGASGSGKSVLLKHIVGLLYPDSGEIYINSRNIYEMEDNELTELRKKMGILFQMSALFDSVTVFENVSFSLKRFTKKSDSEIRDIVRDKLKLVGLENVENKMPSELSGGMQKRVGLARAIALEPKIILYDEPTTGVDPILASAVNDLIHRLNEELDVTSLVVSHDMKSTLSLAHRIAMLYQGNFILVGSSEDFKKSENQIVRQFLMGQAA